MVHRALVQLGGSAATLERRGRGAQRDRNQRLQVQFFLQRRRFWRWKDSGSCSSRRWKRHSAARLAGAGTEESGACPSCFGACPLPWGLPFTVLLASGGYSAVGHLLVPRANASLQGGTGKLDQEIEFTLSADSSASHPACGSASVKRA